METPTDVGLSGKVHDRVDLFLDQNVVDQVGGKNVALRKTRGTSIDQHGTHRAESSGKRNCDNLDKVVVGLGGEVRQVLER